MHAAVFSGVKQAIRLGHATAFSAARQMAKGAVSAKALTYSGVSALDMDHVAPSASQAQGRAASRREQVEGSHPVILSSASMNLTPLLVGQ